MGVSVSEFPNFEIAIYAVPSVTVYNRLECSPRAADFDRSLKAEIRDAMWMLTRQWQFGEFKGEDAATAVTTKILGEHTFINTLNFPNNVSFNYDGSLPLEAIVERETLMPGLALAVQMARHFIKLIKVKPGFATALNLLMNEYPLNYAPAVNDDEGIQLLNSVSGKTLMDMPFKSNHSRFRTASIVNDYSTEIEDFKVGIIAIIVNQVRVVILHGCHRDWNTSFP
jgi:hypothetical protein